MNPRKGYGITAPISPEATQVEQIISGDSFSTNNYLIQ